MDKQTLNLLSESVAYNQIDSPNEGESIEEYVQRVYPQFEEYVTQTGNPIESDIEQASKEPKRNAASKLAVRRRIVEVWCEHRDPVGIDDDDEVTDQDILDLNDIDMKAEDLKEQMSTKGYNNMLKGLKQPSSDGLTETEKRKQRNEHYAGFQPIWPSLKEHSHNSGGKTYKFHWAAELQDEFVADQLTFLDEFGLSDSFPEYEEEADVDAKAEADAE